MTQEAMTSNKQKNIESVQKRGIMNKLFLIVLLSILIIACGTGDKLPDVGETTVLAGGPTGVPSAVSEEAFSRLNQAFRSKDEFAFNQLEKTGQVIVLPNLTAAKVISLEIGSVQVRISSGQYIDRSFFVDPQYVK